MKLQDLLLSVVKQHRNAVTMDCASAQGHPIDFAYAVRIDVGNRSGAGALTASFDFVLWSGKLLLDELLWRQVRQLLNRSTLDCGDYAL